MCPSLSHTSKKTPSHTHLVFGQVGPNGFNFIVEDVVLLHLAVYQRKVCPKALTAQLVLVGIDGETPGGRCRDPA